MSSGHSTPPDKPVEHGLARITHALPHDPSARGAFFNHFHGIHNPADHQSIHDQATHDSSVNTGHDHHDDASGMSTPTHGSHTPINDGSSTHGSRSHTPINGCHTPTNGSHTPTNGSHTPTNGSHTPTHSTTSHSRPKSHPRGAGSHVNFSSRSRKETRKHGHKKASPMKKVALTDAEKLEKKIKKQVGEGEDLAHQVFLGENAAALEIQTVQRGGCIRRYNEALAVEAGAVTIQTVMKGHSQRRQMDPFLYPLEASKIGAGLNTLLAALDMDVDPVLTLEDRVSVQWDSVGFKDPLLEKERSRGRILTADEIQAPHLEEGYVTSETDKFGRLKIRNTHIKVAKAAVFGEDKKGFMEDKKKLPGESGNKELFPREAAQRAAKSSEIDAEQDDSTINSMSTSASAKRRAKPLHPYGPIHMEPNAKKSGSAINLQNDPNIPIANEDMLVWLGKKDPSQVLPLDKVIRKEKRDTKMSLFSYFVDQTLALLDDFEEREKLIGSMDKLKKKVAHIIYKDEKDYQVCKFEDQLRHEYLLEKPLVSQRKFEEGFDNYTRDPKQLKILMATVRRIDQFDCTFLACKMIRYHIDDNWAHQLGKALDGNDYLQQLYLNDNFITDGGAGDLAQALEKNNWALKILNLSGNFISDDGACAFAEMLKRNKNLIDLNLGFKEKKRPFRDRNLLYPRISAPGGSMIAFALQDNYSLTSLNLSGMKIWDAGAAAFAMTLKTRHTLKHLNLANNDIMEPGGLALAKALEANRGLQHFNLSGNKLGDKVGFKFAAALKGAVTLEGSHHGLGGPGTCVLETLDLFDNDLSMLGIRSLRDSLQMNDKLRVVSVYGNRGVGDIGLKNDTKLDNLVATNIVRYKEDKAIKNLVIWHKRLFEKGESHLDYEHFLEIQFGVIKDEVSGQLFEVDHGKLEHRNRGADIAASMGVVSIQPENPMHSLQMKLSDSKSLAIAPTRKPHIVIDIWDEDPIDGVSYESRLHDAWGVYTAKSKAETGLGEVNVKAYYNGDNPFYDSMTRLLQLRVPVPGKNIQHGTISICRLKYLKEEMTNARKGHSNEDWYLRQKAAGLAWKDHVHAKVDLPPDKYVEEQYQEWFPHKYPHGIDAHYHEKQLKLDFVFNALGGGAMVHYSGLSEEDKRQNEVDALMQKMAKQGKSEKDRHVALRMLGAGKQMTADERVAGNAARRETTRERTRKFSRAHTGNPATMFKAKVAAEMATKQREEALAKKNEFAERQKKQLKQMDRRGGVSSGFR